MRQKLKKELTLLRANECLTVHTREHRRLDIPLHFHTEFELNLLENAAGATRLVGKQPVEMGNRELVLIGPGLGHGWEGGGDSGIIRETTLHFHAQLFTESFLGHNEMSDIRELLSRAGAGLAFNERTAADLVPLLEKLKKASGFPSLLLLMRLLHFLSKAPAKLLAENQPPLSFVTDTEIEKAMRWLQDHLAADIRLKDIAAMMGMKESSFSRFFHQRTGKTCMAFLNEIRIDHAARMLCRTTHSIAEIAFSSGFRNISNFNRNFKTQKNLTPTQYREAKGISNTD